MAARYPLTISGQHHGGACGAVHAGVCRLVLRFSYIIDALAPQRPIPTRWLGAFGLGGGGLSISVDFSTHMNSVVLYGRSRSPCLARADGCVPLQGCCTLVGVQHTGCLPVAFFVTDWHLRSSRPLTSHFFLCFCADRLLCSLALAQASSGGWGQPHVLSTTRSAPPMLFCAWAVQLTRWLIVHSHTNVWAVLLTCSDTGVADCTCIHLRTVASTYAYS